MAESSGYARAGGDVRLRAGQMLPDFDDRQYDEWTRLLEKHTGLYFSPDRRLLLVDGVRSRMRATGCTTPAEYYCCLTSQSAEGHEWSLLIDRLTVHETRFFRHHASMCLVRERLVPHVLETQQACEVWSIGCATGEEAYSLAMLLDAAMDARHEPYRMRVTGFDISLPSLQHARRGRYLRRRLGDVPAYYQSRYCRAVSASHFEIADQLRSLVLFNELSLRELKSAPSTRVNLIYCQNLLIYYDRRRRLEIVEKLAEYLLPNGVLILGAGELLGWKHPNMEKVRYPDTLAYRRTN